MKSYKEFQESITQEVSGKGLLNFAGNVAKSLGTQPLEKGVKAVTSLASTVNDFVERRKRKKAIKQNANKTIQNTRDPKADRRVADAKKDPDLKKLDDNPPDLDY